MEYIKTALCHDICIDGIYTIHYIEHTKDYHFAGEAHDFWECVYVDRGEVIATAGQKEVALGPGEILFHQPNEWHTLRANGVVAPNIVVFSFASSSPRMQDFCGRRARVGNRGKALISAIIRESESVFETPLDQPNTHEMKKRASIPVGAEQLIRAHLEELLILLLRSERGKPLSTIRQHADGDMFALLCDFMQENIGRQLTLSDLAARGGISESSVKLLFRTHAGKGAVAYFIRMKVETAKAYIREGNYNLTQISDLLGYESIHYFSRQFRAVAGMSPSEYGRSIRAMESTVKAQDT